MANEAMERERERQVRVKVLLNEMEDVHPRSDAGAREERRQQAIGRAEAERRRRLSELEVAEREEESRRAVARAAARDAAEGERRRQLSLLRLEEEEERRTRRWRQRLANEAMEAERERLRVEYEAAAAPAAAPSGAASPQRSPPPDGLAIMRASIERTVLEAAAGRRVWVGESWPFGANRGSS